MNTTATHHMRDVRIVVRDTDFGVGRRVLHAQSEERRPTLHTLTCNTESKDDVPYLQVAKLTGTLEDSMATSIRDFFDPFDLLHREMGVEATSTSTSGKAPPRGGKVQQAGECFGRGHGKEL